MTASFAYIIFVSLACLSGTVLVECTHSDELYFTDLHNIQLFNRTTTSVIFHDTERLTEALECNICDQRIYWVVLPDKILRGIPGNQSSIETIIDSDLENPRGLALDWKGNNIYFSHLHNGRGRIEVASCDGKHRRWILDYEDTVPGPIAINLYTGHLYFVVELGYQIDRVDLDGSTRKEVHNTLHHGIVFEEDAYKINGLTIDAQNRLYWTAENQSVIRYINITEWERDQFITPQRIPVTYHPYELLVNNDYVYFTELRVMTESAHVQSPGALYSYHMDSQNVSTLYRDGGISPHDLCTFFHTTIPDDTSGCGTNNGGCEVFCFTVPDGNGGTQPQCGCPTGILLKNGSDCQAFPDNFLLTPQVFGIDVTHSEIRQISLDIPSQYIDVLVPVDIVNAEAVHIAYDLLYHKIYWTELDPPQIRRANLNGSDPEVFINSSISIPQDLAVDPFSRNLFWVDAGLDRIEVARLEDARMRKVLVDTNLDHPQGLAVDTRNEYIYWTDLDSNQPRIECARMNGTERRVIPTERPIKLPANIAVDPLTGNVYWVDGGDMNNHIVMYNITSERGREVVSNVRDALGLAVLGDFVYWTSRFGSDSLLRANKLSQARGDAILSGPSGLQGLVAVNVSAESVHTGCRLGDLPTECSHFCLGTSCGCADNFNLQPNGQCEDTPSTIFAVTSTSVDVLSGPPSPSALESWTFSHSLDISTRAIDVDYEENMIYWIGLDGMQIFRSSLTNTTLPDLIVSCCLGNASDLAVDWYGRNLYWVDPVRRVIEVAELDGTRRSVLAVIPKEIGPPMMIELDPLRGDLYWTPKSPPVIYRTKMSHPVFEETEEFWRTDSSDGNTTIAGIALSYFDIESSRDVLYWGVNTQASDSELTIMSRDVTSPRSTAQTKVTFKNTFAANVESFKGTFYFEIEPPFIFTPHGSIKNDANNIVYTLTSPGFLTDLKIMHHSVQPGAHRCGVKNGGCGGDSLCLVKSGTSHVCRCPPGLLAREESDSAGERHLTCFDPDSFLLMATTESITILPLSSEGSDIEPTPRLLPLGVVDDIKVVSYDSVNESVLWMSSDATILHSVALDSSSNVDIPIPLLANQPLRPSSFAYDSLGGNIFISESKFQIEALSINGRGWSSLLQLSTMNLASLDLVGEVVFDGGNSIYWTILDPRTNFAKEIRYMSLRDLNPRTLSLGDKVVRKIDKLTFEPVSSTLIWVNRYHDNNHTIEMLNLTSSDVRNVTVIAGRANDVQALTAIANAHVATDLNVGFQLFWYNTSSSMIYRYSSTTGSYREYLFWQSPGDVVGFVGHRRAFVQSNLPCLASSRPCSHLCIFQTSDVDHQCSCPPHRGLNSDGATCNDLPCDNSLHMVSCGSDDYHTCIPQSYFCDSVPHCRNGFDEENCTCNTTTQLTCRNSDECVPLSARCNGAQECSEGDDEEFCCADSQFGCYVSVDPNLVGRSDSFTCLPEDFVCDGDLDCLDGSDEICPTTDRTTSPPSNTPAAQFDELTLIIVLVVVTSVPILVLFIIGACFLMKRIKRKHDDNKLRLTMIRVGHEMNNRTDSQSENRSEYSENTHTTDLNMRNGSASGSVFKRQSADVHSAVSGPPPSLATVKYHLAEVESALDGDNHTILSVPMSQMSDDNMSIGIPPAPCPSINYSEYDTISANTHVSSVSQRRFPHTLINNGMPIGNDGRPGNVGKNPLRPQFLHHDYNPEMNGHAFPSSLHQQQSPFASMTHYYPHHQRMATNHMRHGGSVGGGGSGNEGKESRAPYRYQEGGVPHNHDITAVPSQSNGVVHHPRKELDSVTRTETESTMSMATENEELQEVFIEDHIPGAPPPGRPPSPVTECEYPPPLSPDSTISYDEDSDEYLSRYSHHH